MDPELYLATTTIQFLNCRHTDAQVVASIQGCGLLKLRSLISLLQETLILQKYKLDTFNYVHICQVSLQLSCGDICQIWTWYHSGNHCFPYSEKMEKKGTEKISLVTPTPGLAMKRSISNATLRPGLDFYLHLCTTSANEILHLSIYIFAQPLQMRYYILSPQLRLCWAMQNGPIFINMLVNFNHFIRYISKWTIL